MVLKFKKLILQNVLSFGNNETEIIFDNGLVLITGKNGVGKSSLLLDAISFALYDKPYRKISKSNLINRTNRKNLKVECEFSVNSVDYRIIRGMKNKSVDLKLFVDGVEQKLLSTKALNQVEIEKIIGIDYKLFKQIISLSINHNKPFLSLTAQEKRELLEKFFNIDTIADMLKKAKESRKSIKSDRDITTASIDAMKIGLSREKQTITTLKESKSTFDTDKKNKVAKLVYKRDDLQEELAVLKESGKSLNTDMKAIGVPEDIELLQSDITLIDLGNSSYSLSSSTFGAIIKNIEYINFSDTDNIFLV